MATRPSIIKAIRKLFGIQYSVEDQVKEIQTVGSDFDNQEDKELIKSFGLGKADGLGKFISELNPVLASKKTIYSAYLALKPQLEPLLNKIVIDVLYKGRGEDENFIKLEYPDEDVLDILNNCLKMFKIESHIAESIFDSLLWGEYYLKVDFPGTEIDDCWEYKDVLVVYSAGKVYKGYMITEDDRLKPIEDLSSILVISSAIPGSRFRLSSKDADGNRVYVKIPSPFIPKVVLPLLNYIMLMESLIPLNQLLRTDRNQLISITVPAGTTINEMFSISRDYESMINTKLKDVGGELDASAIEMILSSFGRYKVIPTVAGSGTKAGMELRDLPKPEAIEKTDFEYLIGAVANKSGVPYSYVNPTTTPAQDDPRAALQYLLKILFIRKSIASSIKKFLCDYVDYRKTSKGDSGYSLDKDKLRVVLPSVPGTEALSTIDYMDGITATLNNVQTIIQNFSMIMGDDKMKGLDTVALTNMLNSKLRPVVGTDVFKLEDLVPVEKTPEEETLPDEEY